MKHLPGHLHLPSISPVAYAAITHQRLLLSCHPRQRPPANALVKLLPRPLSKLLAVLALMCTSFLVPIRTASFLTLPDEKTGRLLADSSTPPSSAARLQWSPTSFWRA